MMIAHPRQTPVRSSGQTITLTTVSFGVPTHRRLTVAPVNREGRITLFVPGSPPKITTGGDMLDHDQGGSDTVIQHLHGLTNPSTTANYDSQVIQTRAMALFGQLKAHNRAANAQTRSHKQATADARAQMDQAHLALQNLLYEKRHLEREIEKCRQFA
jgi:hypothetical protein